MVALYCFYIFKTYQHTLLLLIARNASAGCAAHVRVTCHSPKELAYDLATLKSLLKRFIWVPIAPHAAPLCLQGCLSTGVPVRSRV